MSAEQKRKLSAFLLGLYRSLLFVVCGFSLFMLQDIYADFKDYGRRVENLESAKEGMSQNIAAHGEFIRSNTQDIKDLREMVQNHIATTSAR